MTNRIKSQQNIILKEEECIVTEPLDDYLINTKDKVLVEANARDVHWSCGLPTKEDENTLLDNTKWPGKDRLGEIIMTVRDTLAV